MFRRKIIYFVFTALIILVLVDPVKAAISERGSYLLKDVFKVVIEDVDDDRVKEVLVLTPDKLSVFTVNASLKWDYNVARPKNVLFSDVNKDGRREIIVSAGERVNNVEKGSLHILDGSGKVVYKYESRTGEQYPHLVYNDLVIYDSNNDGYPELFGACSNGVYAVADTFDRIKWVFRVNDSSSSLGGSVEVLSNTSNQAINSTLLNLAFNKTSKSINQIMLLDSGRGEYVLLAASDDRLYTLDFNGKLINSTRISEGIKRVYVGDVRIDKGDEVLVLTHKDLVYLLDSSLKVYLQNNVVNEMTEAALFDLNSDGLSDIVLANTKGIYFLSSRLMASNRFLTNDTTYGLYFVDWDKDNIREIVTASGKNIYSVNTSGGLESIYQFRRSILGFYVSDLENDGLLDAVVVSDREIVFLENNESGMKETAKNKYAEALGLVEMKEYISANITLSQARKIFSDIGDTEGVKLCDALEKDIHEKVVEDMRSQADRICASIEEFIEIKEFSAAINELEKAKEIYTQLNDSEGISRCGELKKLVLEKQKESIKKEEERRKEEEKKRAAEDFNVIPILSILLLTVILVLLSNLILKKK